MGKMTLARMAVAALAAGRRSALPVLSTASKAVSSSTAPLQARLASSSASGGKRPTVQVLHNKPQSSYVQVEQDIAAMQREIRDAYKCVCAC
jgi:hypothetical protein